MLGLLYQPYRLTERERERQTDRQTGRETDRERERDGRRVVRGKEKTSTHPRRILVSVTGSSCMV